jgi:hypothetical protein
MLRHCGEEGLTKGRLWVVLREVGAAAGMLYKRQLRAERPCTAELPHASSLQEELIGTNQYPKN